MKANEAPEKIYIVIDPVWGSMSVNYNRNDTNNIEYIREDVFIEKACDAYCAICDTKECDGCAECTWVIKFRRQLLKY